MVTKAPPVQVDLIKGIAEQMEKLAETDNVKLREYGKSVFPG